jgi:hypothetical protein
VVLWICILLTDVYKLNTGNAIYSYLVICMYVHAAVPEQNYVKAESEFPIL